MKKYVFLAVLLFWASTGKSQALMLRIGKAIYNADHPFEFRNGKALLTNGKEIEGEFHYGLKQVEGFFYNTSEKKQKFVPFKKIASLLLLSNKGDTLVFKRLINKVLARRINEYLYDENYYPVESNYELTVPIYVIDQEQRYPMKEVKKGFWGGLPNLYFVNSATKKMTQYSDYNIEENLKQFLENLKNN